MAEKLCLIDGSGYIFRAFYGLPEMTTSTGIPVNAVYGFTNMFMRLTQKINCDYCLVLFDAKRQNFRNDIFPDYKGTRKETPEALIPQFPIIREAVEALNLHYLEMEGFEADDLIATYAKQGVEQGMDVVVVSADKDLMQLIRPGVEFYDPMKDKFFTPEDVKEKFGVYPDKVVDVQALAGDSTDNVPGVPGIGLKTAAQLIEEFGSLDAVLLRAGEIKQNKRRETLLANIENARISLQLVTLKPDVPVLHKISEYKCQAPKWEVLEKFVDAYEFRGLKSRIEKWAGERCSCFAEQGVNDVFKNAEIVKKYELIQDVESLNRWIAKIYEKGIFAFDTETTGLNPTFDKIVGISLATDAGDACYIPVAHQGISQDLFSSPADVIKQISIQDIAKLLAPLFSAKSILKIGHNIKFDITFLKQILGSNAVFKALEDTAVLSYDIFSSQYAHNLDDLAKRLLDYDTIKYEDICGTGKNKITFDKVPLDKALDYAAEDADITLRLYHILKPMLIQEQRVRIYENFDRPLISILQEMEQEGIKVDVSALQALSKDFNQRMQILEKEVYILAGEEFNLGSPKQIGDILFGKLGFKGKKTATGAWQTGADVLEKLTEENVELAQKILDWRSLSKLKSTYSDALLEQIDKNQRVHTTFSQVVVNTGRLASSNPNLQNIPIRNEDGKKIRECFIASQGCKLIACDYSQVELRLLAAVADVKALKQAFEQGIDIHTATAAKVFGIKPEDVTPDIRRNAKAINFGIVYGISQYGLAKQIGVSNDEAKAYIDAYFREMPEIQKHMEETKAFARANDYVLTPYGRKCAILGINDNNKRLAMNAERAAINAPIQGGASDIIKLAMIKVQQQLKEHNLKTKMLLQVHDELVFEAPVTEVEQARDIIKSAMESVVNLSVPFVAEAGIGDNWAQAH